MRWFVWTAALLLAGAAAWVLLGAPTTPAGGRPAEVSRARETPATARAGERIGPSSREALREILRRADSDPIHSSPAPAPVLGARNGNR